MPAIIQETIDVLKMERMKPLPMKKENSTDMSSYIKDVTDQEMKVLLLKLKNETKKEDVSWEQIRDILAAIGNKDDRTLKDIVSLILD